MATIRGIFINFALSTAVFNTCNQFSHIDILCLGDLKTRKNYSITTQRERNETPQPLFSVLLYWQEIACSHGCTDLN